MRLTKRTTLTTSILAVLLSAAIPVYAEHANHEAGTVDASPRIAQTDAALRDLWVGHVFWVRNVVVETLAGNKEAATAAENEVVANAKQIAASIEPFYGKAASDKLFGLLAGHYGATKQYLEATAAGSQEKQAAAMKSLTGNVEEIAVFLSGANPNLPHDAVKGLFLAHIAHHQQQIQQLHDKQYPQEAQTWEAMKEHMYGIADALTGALAKQFPAKFS
ncbi:MAG TPA: hypothetical protein VGK14_11615 [Novimethylophilus sp.]|jgi:hypothetical protein|uniref:hypothetical protein n=1 Tax=Novimethylophilus sp. TaxID=2137426 RepID=UPI002F42E1E9